MMKPCLDNRSKVQSKLPKRGLAANFAPGLHHGKPHEEADVGTKYGGYDDMDYRISSEQNPYAYMLRNLIMTGPNSGIPDKRGALLLAAQRDTSAGLSQNTPNTDKIHLSNGAQNYLSGFRMELSEALTQPMTPQMLGATLSSKFQEIFRVFSETATTGSVTERLPLYYGVADHGEVDPYLDNVDYFPEIVGAYETEYKKLSEMRESGEIDEKQYEASMNAINALFDDFVNQADMSAILNPAGTAHPLFAMRGAYNADYKQAFENARAYIEQNGSLDGITDDILSGDMTTTDFGTIRDMFSDEGKLLLYDTAALVGECERQEDNKRLGALLTRLGIGEAKVETEDGERERESEESAQELKEALERLKSSLSESKIGEMLKLILRTTLDWTNLNFFGDADEKVSFWDYCKKITAFISEKENSEAS
jgi:hypothetical protein